MLLSIHYCGWIRFSLASEASLAFICLHSSLQFCKTLVSFKRSPSVPHSARRYFCCRPPRMPTDKMLMSGSTLLSPGESIPSNKSWHSSHSPTLNKWLGVFSKVLWLHEIETNPSKSKRKYTNGALIKGYGDASWMLTDGRSLKALQIRHHWTANFTQCFALIASSQGSLTRLQRLSFLCLCHAFDTSCPFKKK